MVQSVNTYMDLSMMITVLYTANDNDVNRLIALFDSINNSEFYTVFGSLMEKTNDVNVRKLANNIFDYYTTDKKGKAEDLFISNLKKLFNALCNNVSKDIQNLMLTILPLEDEKTKYDLLKWLAKTIKNEGMKDRIYLSILDNKYVALGDYNLYLTRFVDNKISLPQGVFKKIISDWIIQIKKYVIVADYPEKDFDLMFRNINKSLVKITEYDTEIAGNIRYVCDIQPINHYEQDYFKKLYCGVNDIMASNTTRFVELRNKAKQLEKTVNNLQIVNGNLEKMLSEETTVREKRLENEMKELKKENEKLIRENDKLIQENKKLKLAVDAANSCAETYKKMLKRSK